MFFFQADIHGGSTQGQAVTSTSLHNFVVDGSQLTWADISGYMRKLGDKLVPTRASNGQDIDFPKIYSEIKCVSWSMTLIITKKLNDDLFSPIPASTNEFF